jgi:DNA-binding NarL/FixJ family response regulator
MFHSAMSELPTPASASVRILVVDDFEPARLLICSILRAQKQFQIVGEGASGLEAVQKAQKLQPDVILLDIGLPLLNGIEAAHRISKVAPGAKILFLSQNNDADVVRSALRNGTKGYVLKANAGAELVLAIEAVLRSEKFFSKELNC